MSLAVVFSRALSGVDAPQVTVEVHLGNGLPSFTIVGLPETEVRESRDRVRAALQTAGYKLPPRRITVNLAPADLPKESGRYDLPIALGVLVASDQLRTKTLAQHEFAGELALDGNLRPVRGTLPMARRVAEAGRAFVLPLESAPAAALIDAVHVLPAPSLSAVCAHLEGQAPLPRQARDPAPTRAAYPDLADVRGQQHARFALEAAAAGAHSLLMVGPPGTGKSMLAHRLPGILPPMTEAEALETAAIQSLTTAGFRTGDWLRRPVRAPHHSASMAALVGGGTVPKPGEISLAHHGVLFLDELSEFRRSVLETMREPLETGRVTISRAARQAEFPARFQLVAAMNPCPCGYLGHPGGRCGCSPGEVARYRGRVSGPLLDRIDIQIEVAAPPEDILVDAPSGEPSSAVRERVVSARERQQARQGKANGALDSGETERFCVLGLEALSLLRNAIREFDLSLRAVHRIRRLARTVADLRGSEGIDEGHLARAIALRNIRCPLRAGRAL